MNMPHDIIITKESSIMKKRCISLLLLVTLMVAAMPSGIMAAGPIKVKLNGQNIKFDVQPVLSSGRVLVPIRSIASAMGATISWNGSSGTVTIKKDSDTLKLTAGSKTAYKNNSKIKLDVPARIVRGRTLAPVRFISEGLNASVKWDSSSRTVNIIQRSKDEIQAIKQVEKYLSILDIAVSDGVDDEAYDGVLTPEAIDSGYGYDAKVFKPMPGQVGSSMNEITDVAIMGCETKSPNEIIVTARFIFYQSGFYKQYIKNYHVVNQNGQWLLDSEDIISSKDIK
jgi:hypothetical protein